MGKVLLEVISPPNKLGVVNQINYLFSKGF